jgi:hypothetical protein
MNLSPGTYGMRPLTAGDWPAVADLCGRQGSVATSWSSGASGGQAIMDGEALRAAVLWRDERAWLGGQNVPVRSLQRLIVHPDDARRNVSEALVAATVADPQAALLFWRPDLPALGMASGFTPFNNGLQLDFRSGVTYLARCAAAGIRPYRDGDRHALMALAAGRNATLNGPTVRDFAAWDTWLATAADPATDVRVLVHEEDGRLDGYLRMRVRQDQRPGQILIDEWLDDGPHVLAAWWGYVAHLTSRGHAVTVATLPMDRPFRTAFDRVMPDVAPDRRMMVRAGRPAAFLPMLNYPQGAGQICLAIADPLGQWPPVIALRWDAARLSDWAPATQAPDAKLTLESWTAITLGVQTIEEALGLGSAMGSPEALASLGGMALTACLHRYGVDQA